jgi:hypothetical protein
MELYERAENVKSREDLFEFINHLRRDLQANKDEWENRTLEDYLEAMAAWICDMEGFYMSKNQPVPKQPTWKTFADILYASSMYE